MEKEAYEKWKISVISSNKEQRTGIALFKLCSIIRSLLNFKAAHPYRPCLSLIFFFFCSFPQAKEASKAQFHCKISNLCLIRSHVISESFVTSWVINSEEILSYLLLGPLMSLSV